MKCCEQTRRPVRAMNRVSVLGAGSERMSKCPGTYTTHKRRLKGALQAPSRACRCRARGKVKPLTDKASC